MPAKTTKGGLFAKYGEQLLEAAAEHQYDEVEYAKFSELPPGIENGIAELVDCRFGQYKTGDMEGEYFWIAAGTVIEPEFFEGQKIRGLRTQIGPEPVCSTPGRTRETPAQHLKWIQNQLKLLGASPDDLSGDKIEDTANVMAQAGICFRFRTWKGQPTEQFQNPRTNHQWNGYCDRPGGKKSAATSTEDSTPVPANGQRAKAAAPATGKAKGGPTPSQAARPSTPSRPAAGRPAPKVSAKPAPKQQEEEGGAPDMELASLVEAANVDDGSEECNAAQDELTRMALEAGLTRQQVRKADNWNDVVEMMQATGAGTEPENEDEGHEEGGGDEEEEGATDEGGSDESSASEPNVGDVMAYRPMIMDARSKKRVQSKTPVDVEITAIDSRKGTATIKRLDNSKEIPGVALDALEWPA